MNISIFYIGHFKEGIFATLQAGLVGVEILFAKIVLLF